MYNHDSAEDHLFTWNLWYNSRGFYSNWIHKDTRTEYDQKGYNQYGYDKNWYNNKWFNKDWIHKDTWTKYDKHWKDKYWMERHRKDEWWFDKLWYNHKTWETKYTWTSNDKRDAIR